MNNYEFISFFDNKEKALQDYLESGFHIEYGIFSDAQCATLISEANSFENAMKEIYTPEMMPHRKSPIFLDAMRNQKLVKIMSLLINGPVSGLQSEFFYTQPSTRGFSLHQDNFYVEAEYGVFASAWAALVDTSAGNGGLIVYPGSHKEGTLPTRKLNLGMVKNQDPNANNEETVVPEKYQPINVVVPKGAVCFIHGHIVHGSNPNMSSSARYVLLNTYIRKQEAFRPGSHAKRAETDLYIF